MLDDRMKFLVLYFIGSSENGLRFIEQMSLQIKILLVQRDTI